MQAASARRCFQPPESLPASWVCAFAQAKIGKRLIDARRAIVESVEPGDEFEIFADRKIFVE